MTRYLACMVGIAAVTVLSVRTASAQLEDLRSCMPARSISLAGVGRSFSGAANALYLNPAALGAQRQYVAGGGYGYLAAADSHLVSAEWIDSTPNAYNLSGGFQYLYATEPGNAFESYSLGAAFTFQFGGTFLSVGTAWHWLFDLRERYSQVRFASHLTPDGRSERGLSGWTEDFGFVANFGNQLLVGAAGYNLVQGTDLDLPRGTGGGISWWSGPIMLSADVSSEFGVPVEDGKEEDRIAYMGAFQFMATHGIYLRGGMSRDEPVGQTRLAGGLGIVGGSIGIEVGYQHNLTDTRDYIVAAGLQIYDPFGPGQGLQ